jgi:hypothetical protein
MNRHPMSSLATIMAAISLPVLAYSTQAAAQTSPPASPSVMSPAAPKAVATAATAGASLPKATAEKVEQHIAQLHSKLEITPAEEPQWKLFAQVMRDNAAQMGEAFSARGANLATMTAVQDVQSYAQIAQIQADNMQKLATAFQTLYHTFPAPQQKLADAVFRENGYRQKTSIKP